MRLDVSKAIQAACVLLRRDGNRMSRLRLLKLLYLSERKHLRQTGTLMLGGRFVATNHGPVHGDILALMNSEHMGVTFWSSQFHRIGRDIQIDDQPGVGELSPFEIDLLNSISDQFLSMDDWELAELTRSFPEFKAHTGSVIGIGAIIDGVGLGARRNSVLASLDEQAALKESWGKSNQSTPHVTDSVE